MSGTMLSTETVMNMRASQEEFLRKGGGMENQLRHMRSQGLISSEYVYHEYPKMLRIVKGTQEVKCSVLDVDKNKHDWTETREIVDEIIVNSEAEEERVLNGGKTAAQIEEERQGLIALAKSRGVQYDPSWSMIRLQRELGLSTGAPETAQPFDEVSALKVQIAKAEEAIELRKKLAALQAQLDAPDEPEDDIDAMRADLTALGVKVDGRWSPARLRLELDKATAQQAA